MKTPEEWDGMLDRFNCPHGEARGWRCSKCTQDVIAQVQREARAEAFEEAMHHIYCRMGARSTPLKIIAALKELAAKDPE